MNFYTFNLNQGSQNDSYTPTSRDASFEAQRATLHEPEAVQCKLLRAAMAEKFVFVCVLEIEKRRTLVYFAASRFRDSSEARGKFCSRPQFKYTPG